MAPLLMRVVGRVIKGKRQLLMGGGTDTFTQIQSPHPQRWVQAISTSALSSSSSRNRLEDERGDQQSISDSLEQLTSADLSLNGNIDFNLDPITGECKSESEIILDNMSALERKSLEHFNRVREDPNNTSIMLFPGQGAQFVGMGRDVLAYPNVTTLYNRASEILGYDLLNLCLNGPKHELDSTARCQPAVVVTSLAAVEKLRENNPQALNKCVAAAGYSVGEITALIFSQALSFDEGIRLVKRRSTLMQQACDENSGGLLLVIGSHQAKFRRACFEAREHIEKMYDIENPICQISNYLFPHSRVIGGHIEALKFIQEHKRDFGLLRAKLLPVSGAFHTPLMSSAVPGFRAALQKVDMIMPVVCCYSNINGHKYTTVQQIKKFLAKQLTSAVRWEQLQHVIYERTAGESFPQSFELGPSNQLGQMLEKTNLKAHHKYTNVSV